MFVEWGVRWGIGAAMGCVSIGERGGCVGAGLSERRAIPPHHATVSADIFDHYLKDN